MAARVAVLLLLGLPAAGCGHSPRPSLPSADEFDDLLRACQGEDSSERDEAAWRLDRLCWTNAECRARLRGLLPSLKESALAWRLDLMSRPVRVIFSSPPAWPIYCWGVAGIVGDQLTFLRRPTFPTGPGWIFELDLELLTWSTKPAPFITRNSWISRNEHGFWVVTLREKGSRGIVEVTHYDPVTRTAFPFPRLEANSTRGIEFDLLQDTIAVCSSSESGGAIHVARVGEGWDSLPVEYPFVEDVERQRLSVTSGDAGFIISEPGAVYCLHPVTRKLDRIDIARWGFSDPQCFTLGSKTLLCDDWGNTSGIAPPPLLLLDFVKPAVEPLPWPKEPRRGFDTVVHSPYGIYLLGGYSIQNERVRPHADGAFIGNDGTVRPVAPLPGQPEKDPKDAARCFHFNDRLHAIRRDGHVFVFDGEWRPCEWAPGQYLDPKRYGLQNGLLIGYRDPEFKGLLFDGRSTFTLDLPYDEYRWWTSDGRYAVLLGCASSKVGDATDSTVVIRYSE